MFDAWRRGDFTTAPALFGEGIRFTAQQPEGHVTAEGPGGIVGFMQRFLPEWKHYYVELHELEDLGGGDYIAAATQHGTGVTSGVDITAPAYIALRMVGGKLTEMHFFFTREEALGALAA